MRTIKITADSSCDLFELNETPFSAAPMKVITDEREFTDDAALDVGEMVAFLDGYRGKSQSSCPNPADWLEAFGDADDVICFTITSGLSGSYNAAVAAKKIYENEHEGRRVFVLDTLTAGAEVTMLVEKAEEMASAGHTFDEITEALTAYSKKTGLLFMLKSLKTFANNGRVSPLAARLVGIAGICIVGKASDEGTLEPMHKCRGEKRSLDTLAKTLADEGYSGGRIRIGHCENEEGALLLKGILCMKYPAADITIHPLRGLCSFYAERGGVLVGFEKA